MFCSKCGNMINDGTVICPKCGCPTNLSAQPPQRPPYSNGPAPQYNYYSNQPYPPQNFSRSDAPNLESGETTGLATAALICAIAIPILGLILGIIGTVKYNTSNLKNRCIIAIVLSIVIWAVSAILISVSGAFY